MTEAVGQFMTVLSGQPLSLALCAMNLLLLYFLFKQGNDISKQRQETIATVVKWQTEMQTLLADCVNKDIMLMIITALERDRTLYRKMVVQGQGQAPIPETEIVEETKP